MWSYRGFIAGSAKREFQSRYQNSILGAAWLIINPLAMIVVYTVIFSQMMRSRLPGIDSHLAYSIYLCAGSLTWTYFAEVTTRSINVFVDNANLIKKISFPRICLPVIVIVNSTINFGIIFGIFVCFLVISGNFPGWVFFDVFPVLGVQILFSIGLGMILGVLNVFFRDVGQLFGVLIQFWFWLTPIVYPVTVLPEKIKELLAFNPMAAVVGAYQDILVKHVEPQWSSLLPCLIAGLVMCALGLRLFRNRSGELVDEL
ncbi:ABC transporter permease [Cupriavidus oxalaticus]|uniref:Transport permease protein n=1 Tax=Cupriavidus oxalaticus TaxID=96344 RepID=A0A4P7LH26_9BURK|nr:ABC transporter permease [Cupriavidus oxalaticus]